MTVATTNTQRPVRRRIMTSPSTTDQTPSPTNLDVGLWYAHPVVAVATTLRWVPARAIGRVWESAETRRVAWLTNVIVKPLTCVVPWLDTWKIDHVRDRRRARGSSGK